MFGFYCDALSNDGNEHSQSETSAYRSEEKWAFFGFFSFTIDIRFSVLGLVTLVRDRVKKKKRKKRKEKKTERKGREREKKKIKKRIRNKELKNC